LAIVFLSLGSNLGDREFTIKKALDLLGLQVGKLITKSSVYETESWGVKSNNMYINMVVEIQTQLPPYKLMYKILEIEKQLGRERNEQILYQDRTIDIDILFYDNIILFSEKLEIPHPKIVLRRFVLEPLNEIAPNLFHPSLNKAIRQILNECNDTSLVTKL
jgi:deoxyguanosine kinase